MTIAPFCDRVAMMDQCSVEFLTKLVALGGYCTAAQAKQLSIANSGIATRARPRAWERSGFLRKIAAYPIVYQVTKSTTRLLDRDSRARRTHALATVQARLPRSRSTVDRFQKWPSWPRWLRLQMWVPVCVYIEMAVPAYSCPSPCGVCVSQI